MKTHLEAKDFPCPVCQKVCKCKGSLKHCLSRHENPHPEVFPCNVENCGVVLSTSNGFKGHVKTHGYRERLPCHVCSSKLSTKTDLKRHIRKVHSSEEKKFSCSICGTKTVTSPELTRHMLVHSGDVFPCPVEGCTSKSNTQYGSNFHFKKKHGQIKHRRSVDEIRKDQDRRLDCTLCDKKIRAGASPLHSMKLHMMTHEKQVQIGCPTAGCETTIGASSNSYSFPVQYYNHLEQKHNVSFEEHQIQVEFHCKLCEQTLILKTLKTKPNDLNLSSMYQGNWGEKLKSHIMKMHNGQLKRLTKGLWTNKVWAELWAEFFKRGNVTVCQIKEIISFIDKLLASKKCELGCDFDVQKQALQHPALKHPSTSKQKLLKHYCSEHFKAQLLKQESRYFQGARFPMCLHCDFEMKNVGGDKSLNTKAVHIGLFHNEIITILENFFEENWEQGFVIKNITGDNNSGFSTAKSIKDDIPEAYQTQNIFISSSSENISNMLPIVTANQENENVSVKESSKENIKTPELTDHYSEINNSFEHELSGSLPNIDTRELVDIPKKKTMENSPFSKLLSEMLTTVKVEPENLTASNVQHSKERIQAPESVMEDEEKHFLLDIPILPQNNTVVKQTTMDIFMVAILGKQNYSLIKQETIDSLDTINNIDNIQPDTIPEDFIDTLNHQETHTTQSTLDNQDTLDTLETLTLSNTMDTLETPENIETLESLWPGTPYFSPTEMARIYQGLVNTTSEVRLDRHKLTYEQLEQCRNLI